MAMGVDGNWWWRSSWSDSTLCQHGASMAPSIINHHACHLPNQAASCPQTQVITPLLATCPMRHRSWGGFGPPRLVPRCARERQRRWRCILSPSFPSSDRVERQGAAGLASLRLAPHLALRLALRPCGAGFPAIIYVVVLVQKSCMSLVVPSMYGIWNTCR